MHFSSPVPGGPSTPAAAFDGVGVIDDETVLLRETTGYVGAGEVLAITGANGSGKTTRLRALVGLLTPTAGTVTVMGRVPDDRDRRHRASLAALIGPPQTARDLTVVEHLQFVAATWGTSAAAARETAQALLEEFAITSLARRFPHELSSGQSQLAALARTRALPCQVLLLDEPEQRLVPERLDLGIRAVRARADGGTALVIATHSPRLLEKLADRRLHLGEPV